MLLKKNVIKQMLNNRVFVVLLWVLTMMTSMSYFFVQCSIDGNMDIIMKKKVLSENEVLWKNALYSNATLANIFLISTVLLSCFVFCLFFYRYVRANKVQIGCLKALGMSEDELRLCFIFFSVILSIIDEIVGVFLGYMLSGVLVKAYMASYQAYEAIRGIHLSSIAAGCGIPVIAYVMITMFCFNMIKGKEAGVLLSGNMSYKKQGLSFRIANAITRIIPADKRFPFRIALRKPVAIMLMFVAIIFFQVCVILGQSLHLSSQKIMNSQMSGHKYQYDIRFQQIQEMKSDLSAIPYIYEECTIVLKHKEDIVEQTAIGLYELRDDLLELLSRNQPKKEVPEIGTVYINPGLAKMYDYKIGDEIIIDIRDRKYSFIISDIIDNAKTASIYCNAQELAGLCGYDAGNYNGLLSAKDDVNAFEVESMEQRIERLQRDAVSNKVSAVINQITGVITGVILLFLALYLNFQDNQRDMDILRLIGYDNAEIRRLFVDIYWPITMVLFMIGIIPSVFLARFIQKCLSISINDYMPFGIHAFGFLFMFFLIQIIYGCVWLIFCRTLFGKK